MFGQNPARKKSPDRDLLWVEEIYQTVQGEGPYSGDSATFIRLSGCNLKCYWCDTQFELFKLHLYPLEIIKEIYNRNYPPPELVVITGGEPFRQNIAPLINDLLQENFKVQIETNGTIHRPLNQREKNITIVCSPKTPQLHPQNIKIITHYKYVVAHGEIDAQDGLPDFCTQVPGKQIRLFRAPREKPIYLMPRDDYDPEINKKNRNACIEVAMKYGRTLNIQLHKHLQLP
ncbi:MAG: 7-carboxy-7-deazaguanine synthase QueE [Candidatus Dasytiphilus stammeri]